MALRIARRLGYSLLVLIGITVIAFSLLHLSGDPATLLLPVDATPGEIVAFRELHGLDKPLPQQYFTFLSGLLRGDFGTSLYYNRPTIDVFLERLPATLALAVVAQALAISIALPLGVLAALKRNTIWDRASMVVAVLGQSVPGFWLALMLILLFGVTLRWLPISGMGGPLYFVLPAVALGVRDMARLSRILRSSLVEQLGNDYVRTAYAKGLTRRAVIGRHVLRNALIPVVTLWALDLGTLFNGSVIIETVFAWPGVGSLLVLAINNRDYPMVQTILIVSGATFIMLNLLADLAYAKMDPRIG